MIERPKKTISVTIRIDEETYKRINDIVTENDSTMSYEIRKMVNYFFKNKKLLEDD